MAQRQGRGAGRGAAGSGVRAGGGRSGSGAGGGRSGGNSRGRPPAQRDLPAAAPIGPAPNRARVREVIEPVVTAAGYDLDGLSLGRAGRRHLVRLTVDRDGGVNLDAVADVSRLVSAALDEAENGGETLFVGEYELQVSSPGVDRPLTLPRHWRRNVGRLVQVKQLTGRVTEADDTGVVLTTADGSAHTIAYGDLGTGKIQLEFKRLEAISDDDLEEIAGAEEYDDEDADDDFEEDEE